MKLSEIKNNQMFYDVHALVTKMTIATTRTGKDYADVVLRDGNTILPCKKWNFNTLKYGHILNVGAVVKVSGKCDTYQGALQGNLETIEASDKSPEDFTQSTRFSIDEMYSDIMKILESFTEVLPKYIAHTLLTKYKTEFCRSPAALGVHQAWVGGLLEHTHNMLSLALPIVGLYQSKYGHHVVSRDKVLFGVIMHDFGKIFEYDSSGAAFKMKAGGILANHIVKCPIIIHETAMEWYASGFSKTMPSDFNFEFELDQLIHLIVTHHGKQEHGSPVVPATLEAVLLHHIDLVDSKFMTAFEHAQGKSGEIEGFSARTHKVQYLQPKKPEELEDVGDIF